MPTVIKIVTPEDNARRDELIAGRNILSINVSEAGKFITVEDDDVQVISLEEYNRKQLNIIAEYLKLDPKKYSSIPKIIKAIKEVASPDKLTQIVSEVL